MAPNSELSWILLHWLNFFMCIPLGDGVGCAWVCAHEHMHVCVCVGADELCEWKLFLVSCRREVRSSCWNRESPSPLRQTPCIRPPILVGAILNESCQGAKHKPDDNIVQYQLPPKEEEGITPVCTFTQTYISTRSHRNTFLLFCSHRESERTSAVFRRWLSVKMLSEQRANYLCFFCSRSL